MNYSIEAKYKVQSRYGSKGCQVKYYRNNFWYKVDGICNEGINEHVASLILKHSNFNNYVRYSVCKVNNKPACRSKNFLQENEVFKTVGSILQSLYGVTKAEDYLWAEQDFSKRFNILVNSVLEYTGGQVNITLMLQQIFYFDMLILNRDRHLDNLGIIVDTQNKEFKLAPIFDNGLSLLGGCQGDVYQNGIEYAVSQQSARTISGSFYQQALTSTNGQWKSPIKINFDSLFSELKKENTSKYIMNVLAYQYKNIGKLYQ